MKKLKIMILLSMSVLLSCFANSAPVTASIVVEGTAHDALFDIDIRGDAGFAVGYAGDIYHTVDAGKTWSREHSDNTLALLGVSFSKSSTIAVGQYGLILVRDRDGGWRKVESGTEERLFAVDVNNNGYAIASGSFGTLLRSVDGGNSWESVAPSWAGIFDDPDNRLGSLFDPSLYGVKVSESGRAWVVGELALIINSDDGGMNWTVVNAGGSSEHGVSPTLSAIDMRSDGVAYAVGQEGFMLKSLDFGGSWRKLKSATHQNLLSVKTKRNGLVVVPGMRDILMSTNDGVSWNSVVGLDIQVGWYGSVAIPTSGSGILVAGNNGNIIKVD
tara:strand:+ start:13441 stop:14430 length:990 start_codon:yes stop_codon:yes gene_type:complete